MNFPSPTYEPPLTAAPDVAPEIDQNASWQPDFADHRASQLYAPLKIIADSSRHLTIGCAGTFSDRAQHFRLTRVSFIGPAGGGDPIRLGIFAALRGDEVEGAEAVVEFLSQLEADPMLAQNYHLHVYPICNPSGFEDVQPQSRSGRDLLSEFGCSSYEPAVYYLERDLEALHFDGVITLRGSCQVPALRILTRSAVLSKALAEPAMQAAEPFTLAVAQSNLTREKIHGFAAMQTANILTRLFELRPSPFELILETPRRAPKAGQIQGIVAALKSILDSYRQLQSHRANI